MYFTVGSVASGWPVVIATLALCAAGCSSDSDDNGDRSPPASQNSPDPTPDATDDGSGGTENTPPPEIPNGAGEDPGASVRGTCATGEILEVVATEIAADETWGCTLAPYTIQQNLSVIEGAALSLNPGVTVAFARDTSLVIGDGQGGRLSAVGMEAAPIRFTSQQSSPAPGDWQAIVVQAEGATADFKHAILEFGGTYSTAGTSPGEGMLQIVGAEASVVDSTFRDGWGYGIVLRNGSRATEFHDNTFSHNPSAPIYAEPEILDTLRGPNTFDDGDRVKVPAGWVTQNTTWDSLGAPYEIQGDIIVGGRRLPVLTIEAGATLLFGEQASLVVGNGQEGSLYADGTDAPILFSAATTSPSPGAWRAVVFDKATNSSQTLIKGSIFQYCGGSGAPSSKPIEACIGVIDSSPTIHDTDFSHSSGDGIQLVGTASPSLSGNTYTAIADEDVSGP